MSITSEVMVDCDVHGLDYQRQTDALLVCLGRIDAYGDFYSAAYCPSCNGYYVTRHARKGGDDDERNPDGTG